MTESDVLWKGATALAPFRVAIESLTEDPDNVRDHNEKNLRSIEQSLLAHGQTQLLVCYRGKVLTGNGRLSVMRKLGWTNAAVIDVTEYFKTEDQAKAYAIGDNHANDLATWDFKTLSGQLAALPKEALPWTGYEGFEWQVLIQAAQEWKTAAAQPKIEKPDKVHTDEPRIVTRPLTVTREEAETVLLAIACVKEIESDGHIKDGRAIELICANYLA